MILSLEGGCEFPYFCVLGLFEVGFQFGQEFSHLLLGDCEGISILLILGHHGLKLLCQFVRLPLQGGFFVSQLAGDVPVRFMLVEFDLQMLDLVN